ncbi:MAG: hypothetical protein M3Q46_11050 [Verrucomicrobiota bacterium]|nr:hypothetical protein [Verrucomicrobiota bacterium]
MRIKRVVLKLGLLALVPGLTAQAQTSPAPAHREITVWISSPTGSHLGAGYASSYLTNIRARTLGQDDPKLRQAIQSLEGLGMKPVKGFGLLPSAVAWQSEKRMRTIIQQQADTGLSYGELLLANALAAKSRKSFDRIVSMRAKTRSWDDLADQLDVDRDFLAWLSLGQTSFHFTTNLL